MRTPRIGKLMAQKVGDWDGTIRFIQQTLGVDATRVVQNAQKTEAENLVEVVKGHIENQDLPWVPLSPRHVLKKGHDNIYQHTGVYYNNIRVWKEGKAYLAGVKKGVLYTNRGGSKISLETVARWMEFGTRRLPERPLWRPSIEEVGGATGIRNRIAKTLYKHISSNNPGTLDIKYKEIRSKVK